ncbi:MAG: NAD(P)/FAD-dependent oxidoreductase [Alphaproteobacteria bacterium]
MDHIDTIIIGAGVVGLAIAAKLAEAGHSLIVIEQNSLPAQGVTSRNSGVIHAGLYYPAGSLKANLCVQGRHQLYDFCAKYHIDHRAIGKIIAATTPQELPILENIMAQAAKNGVDDLSMQDQADLKLIEPNLKAMAGLYSPSTGIIDVHEYCNALIHRIEAAGGMIALQTHLDCVQYDLVKAKPYFTLDYNYGNQRDRIACTNLVNASGLNAVSIAQKMHPFYDPLYCPQSLFAKGNYFSLNGKPPFSHLIYPVPEKGGLGVHYTLDLGGNARFGPDVEWLDNEINMEHQHDIYHVDSQRMNHFHPLIRRYYPDLADDQLQADYAGIRPKIKWNSRQIAAMKLIYDTDQGADFALLGANIHGIQGLVQCFGIESPGLTASLAIADHVETLL